MQTSHLSLDQWLIHLGDLHPIEIELGLKRISTVARSLNLIHFDGKVITVAGTNGKGTTCAFLESILNDAGYKVGVYSSPHITNYTERLRINRSELSELDHCKAFEVIEKARGEISLSYFEYATLACLYLMKQEKCEFIILEVGLGGRLDATNVVESDLSVITTIDIDHIDWLGSSREKIGFEKAGIFRANKPAICGEFNPPESLKKHAIDLDVNILYANKDFSYTKGQETWSWKSCNKTISNIKQTLIPIQNASTALAVIESLDLNLSDALLKKSIEQTKLAGRLQKIENASICDLYLDVAHNVQSAEYLAGALKKLKSKKPSDCKIYSIVGMLKDKEMTEVFTKTNKIVNSVALIPLDCHRGADLEIILNSYKKSSGSQSCVNTFQNIELAYKTVLKNIKSSDIIIIYGSFYTVSNFLTFQKDQ